MKTAQDIIRLAYDVAIDKNLLPKADNIEIIIEKPKDNKNGDISTSFAMQTAKIFGKSPRDIANIIIDCADLTDSYFKDISIAGPGFINFSYTDIWFLDKLKNAINMGENYGKSQKTGEKIMLEFVSANPTGSMHMGNARGGVLGDSLASVLSWSGADVSREFYINDAGNQVDLFGKSIYARYLELKGEESEFPENGYHGNDVHELAKKYIDEVDEPDIQKMIDFGLKNNIEKIKSDLKRYKINYDVWFSESTLYENDYVKDTIALLTKAGKTYEKDGAIWLNTSKLGLEKDDVLMRANGFYTYFAADIAYHRQKIDVRKFDKTINVWGADHHGHVLRLKYALDALGLDGTGKIEIILMQLVKLVRDGEVVKMSKRTGKSITLTDLLEDISVDCARFYFNMRKADTHLDFDLDLALRQDSENPLYYVQYAHARICSILNDNSALEKEIDIKLLKSEEERNLIKQIASFPDEILISARERDPSKINKYAISLAAAYHKFYGNHKINDENIDIKNARTNLCLATKITIKNALTILGVSAPEKM